MAVSSQVLRLVTATVAGDDYRANERSHIEQDLDQVEGAELLRALNAAHVAPLFLAAFDSLALDRTIREELVATLRNHRIYNDALLAQLAELRRAFGELRSHRPLVLKGPSLWGWLYPDVASRKTRDLDILIQDRDDLKRAVEALDHLGFDGDFARIGKAIDTREHYELPALAKYASVAVSSEDDERLNGLLTRYPSRPDFVRDGDGSYRLLVEVELHKSFFLYDDGSYAPLPRSLVVAHELIPGFDRLTLVAQLPYVAAKFGMDTEGNDEAPPQAQSIKLLADFVRMMERADDDEIATSMDLSRLWHCERFYGNTIRTAAPLLPSIEFDGLTHAPYDLDGLIAMAAA